MLEQQGCYSLTQIKRTGQRPIIWTFILKSLLYTLFLYTTAVSAKTVPDFARMSVVDRKQAFINTLLPIIHAQNKRLNKQRSHLQTLSTQTTFSTKQKKWLERMAQTYKVPMKVFPPTTTWFTLMLRRVDSLPPSLVLVQAANESGWGTSRFAQEGNNYFGMWCYTQGCGLVPKHRAPGKTNEVQVFPSLQASVAAYYNNINTNDAYAQLRVIRAAERADGIPLDSIALIQGLEHYSQRGEAYVVSLSQWIQQDNLQKYDVSHQHTADIPYYQQAANLYNE